MPIPAPGFTFGLDEVLSGLELAVWANGAATDPEALLGRPVSEDDRDFVVNVGLTLVCSDADGELCVSEVILLYEFKQELVSQEDRCVAVVVGGGDED